MRRFINHTLDTLTRILRVDVRYFARGGAWLSGGQFAMSGMAMISAIAFANLLPEETFGQYRFVLSIISILSLTTLVGMETSLARAVSRGFEKTFSLMLKTRIRFGVLGTVLALICSGYYAYNGNFTLAGALLISAIFIPLRDPLRAYNTLLEARKKFSTVAIYRVLTQAVSLTSLIVAMFVSDSLYLLLIAYFLPITLFEIALLVHTLHTQPLRGEVDPNAMRYGYHLSFLKSMGGIAGNMQNILLFHFLGPVGVATYYFATAPIEQVRGLIGNIETLLFPKTAQDTWNIGTLQNLLRKLTPSLVILFVGTLIYIFTAPFLFTLIFPEYTHAVIYTQLFAPTIIITAINTVLFTIVHSKQLTRLQYTTSVIDVIITLCVTMLLLTQCHMGIYSLIATAYLSKFAVMSVMLLHIFAKQKN